MTSPTPNPYDQFAYATHAYPETHPDRLATIGTLYGLTPAPVTKCRVLEIGCGDGNNLLPMAYTLPGSEFFGFDLAAQPIARGREWVADLGLRNLRLEALDILDFPPDAGEFDYITAHGVYSWTPPAVRDAVLALCGRHLAPHGIAFVSFNAYPGYHLHELERRMMLYHLDRTGTDPEEARVRQAVSLLGFISNAQDDENPHKKILANAVENYNERLRKPGGVPWFCHDLLEEYNQPFYLHEFVDRTETHGMQFLSEANFRLPRSMNLSQAATAALHELRGDLVAQEQYLDFIASTSFRRVLLCRSGAPLDRSLAPARVAEMHVRGDVWPAGEATAPGGDPHAPETFRVKGGEVTLTHPLGKAAVRLLGRAWPHGYAFDELLAAARANVGSDEASAADLGGLLIMLHGGALVELSTLPSLSTLRVTERPEASAVARLQIRQGTTVTTLRHLNAILSEALNRRLLGMLDGTRTREDLGRELRAWIESGAAAREYAASVDPGGKTEPVPTLESLEASLNATVEKMAQMELLIR